jgi:hypothetical protein
MSVQTQREYLIANGFTPGARGRFSKEMIDALIKSGQTFTKPIKEPKTRTKGESTPLT